MSAIIKRELSSYFNSAIGYIVLAVFYFFSGLFFYMYCLLSNTTSMSYVFLSMLMVVMLVIPIITMKSFSEERKQKTDQALLTAPISQKPGVAGSVVYPVDEGVFIGDPAAGFLEIPAAGVQPAQSFCLALLGGLA